MSGEDITKQVIHAYYKVYNTLGHGFLENVYKDALKIELTRLKIKVVPDAEIKVFYEKEEVGTYTVDFLVDNAVLVMIRAEDAIRVEDEALLRNCLKATIIESGLLLNFGIKAQFKRKHFQSELKKNTLKTGGEAAGV